mgnify:CR=1 FL=1
MSEGVPVSATDNWVPTTEEVREVWSHESPNSMFSIADAEIEFDRWLAAERAKAWDAGFTERGNQEQMQRRDRFHAIERENPYSEVQ